MAGFVNSVAASFVLLLLMAVGYAMGKMGWMTAQEKKFLSKYIVNIAVPANCISGIVNHLDRAELAAAGPKLIAAGASIIVTFVISAILATLLKLPRKRWGVFVAMGAIANTLFIGIPVCTQIFGDACMPYVMMYFLANTVFLQSVGVMLLERAGSTDVGKTTLGGFLKSMFTKPPILGVLTGVAIMVLGLPVPAPLMRFVSYISDTVSPLALMYCGYIVYELGLKNIRFMPGHATMLVVRLLISPALCLLFCRFAGMSGLALAVFVVESGLPVVIQVTVMAGAYGADEKYAATGVCLSILGSFFTIPIWTTLLG